MKILLFPSDYSKQNRRLSFEQSAGRALSSFFGLNKLENLFQGHILVSVSEKVELSVKDVSQNLIGVID